MSGKLYFVLATLCVAISLCHAADPNPPRRRTFEVVHLERDPTASIDSTPFFFSSLYLEDVVFFFSLHDRFKDTELLSIGEAIHKAVTKGTLTQLRVPNFKGSDELVLAFKPLRRDSSTYLLVISNYDFGAKKLSPASDLPPTCWAAGFELVHGKLINVKKTKGKPRTDKDQGKTDTANDYLFDSDPKNDALIEGLLVSDIEKRTAESPDFSRVVLSQYYMSIQAFDKADRVLKQIDIDLGKPDRKSEIGNIADILRITKLELELTRRLQGTKKKGNSRPVSKDES